MIVRTITKQDRLAAVNRLASEFSVHLSESQIEHIRKATGQDRGVRYSAIVLRVDSL